MIILSRSGPLKYLLQREKNSLFIEFRVVWSLTSPESTIFMIFQSPNVFRTTVKNIDCVPYTNQKYKNIDYAPSTNKKHIYKSLPTQGRGKKTYMWGPRFPEVEVRRGVAKEKETLPFCNVSGKKKGHLRGIWRTGGVGAGELPRATSWGNFSPRRV